jgi:hypothetical protein
MSFITVSERKIDVIIEDPSIRTRISKNYKNNDIKIYCYENGIKLGGRKTDLVNRIYRNFGNNCILGNKNWFPKIDTSLFAEPLNEIEDNQLIDLKSEISGTMQHNCVNRTTNCIFGKFYLSTFLKIFYIPEELGERKRQGWHSNNKKRLINGKYSKELFLSKLFKFREIPNRLRSIIIN